MTYFQTALAIDESDEGMMTFKRDPDGTDIKETPDGRYIVYRWDWGQFPFDMSMLANIRHTLMQASDEGEFYQEIIEEDNRGYDEEFFDILEYGIEFTSWGSGIGELSKWELERKLAKAMAFLNEEQKREVEEC